jgi:hypothetical protein
MRKPKPPCPPDCGKRQVGCRKDCEAWQEYERQQAEYRQEKDTQIRHIKDVIEYKKDFRETALRKKKIRGRK